jgi:hypothetical protein
MLKKVILAIAAIGVSSAALAHDGRDYDRVRDRDHDRDRVHRVVRVHEVRRPVIVEHARPVVVEPAPRVVYAPPRVVYPEPASGIDIHLPL